MYHLLILFFTALLVSSQEAPPPSLQITSPPDYSVLVVKPPQVKLNDLIIDFTTANVPENSEICVIISVFGNNQHQSEKCIESNSNNIGLSGNNIYSFLTILFM